MQEITLTIKLQLAGATVEAVDVQTDGDSSLAPGLAPFERRVLGSADPEHRPYMERYIAEATERGARRLPPSTGNRPYINFAPPIGRLEKRIAALAPSGRLAVFVDPEYADRFEQAEVVLNRRVPAYVKVYLNNEGAIRDALALTEIALDER